MRLAFNVKNTINGAAKIEKLYGVFKNGDDVRQDQMVIQMINVIDNLLKRINVDLEFTAYKVLACSNDDGILEFINNAKTV